MEIKIYLDQQYLIQHGCNPVKFVRLKVDLSILTWRQRKLIAQFYDDQYNTFTEDGVGLVFEARNTHPDTVLSAVFNQISLHRIAFCRRRF